MRITSLAHLLCFVFAIGVLALASKSSYALNPEPPSGLVDKTNWVMTKSATADVGGQVGRVDVFLFRSHEIRGSTGTGKPMYAVQVIAAKGNAILYRFNPSSGDSDLYVEDRLDVKDVVGDGSQEVIFSSGVIGASDWVYHVHILKLASNGESIEDAAHPDFVKSWRHEFDFLGVGEQTLPVVAEPVWPKEPERSCHGCPAHYRYHVFDWDTKARSFVEVDVVDSRRDFDGS